MNKPFAVKELNQNQQNYITYYIAFYFIYQNINIVIY